MLTGVSMPPPAAHQYLPILNDRHSYFLYLDRRPVRTAEDETVQLPTRSTVSAYALETSSPGTPTKNVLASSGILTPIDETLSHLQRPDESHPWALVELDNERFPTVYTALPASLAARRINDLQRGSAILDRTWISSSFLWRLWQHVETTVPEYRFSQITFEHEGLFSNRPLKPRSERERQENLAATTDEAPSYAPDRRKANLKVTERINVLRDIVLPWREQYNALSSIVQIRVPAYGRGGYDVFHDGRFTNRSDSASAFRDLVRDVIALYATSTATIEEDMRVRTDQASGASAAFAGFPLYMEFSNPLDDQTFSRWIATFRRRNNRFRLWGNPLLRGPNKAHIYAVDYHLWQTIDLEISTTHLRAILPQRTCGNVVHRLVTSVQRFVDPAVNVYLGDQTYDAVVRAASNETWVNHRGR